MKQKKRPFCNLLSRFTYDLLSLELLYFLFLTSQPPYVP